MRRRLFIKTARAGALASLLWGPSIVLLQQAQVAAADVGEGAPEPPPNEAIGFLKTFWSAAY